MHGDEAHPLDGGLKYDLDDDLEILIRKMPEDPDGLDWSELQTIVAGLWEYVVTGMRYRTVTFDILNVEYDTQIGWGHIVKRERDSLSSRTARRGLQLTPVALPSSANPTSGQRNSSLPTPIGLGIDWRVEDSDMAIRFSYMRGPRSGREFHDPAAVKHLFAVVIEIIQKAIATHGDEAKLDGETFYHGREIVLEVIDWKRLLTWGQLATAVVGLVEFIVDHNHYRSWYFSIFVGDPVVEIGIGKIDRGYLQNSNVTVARRNPVDGERAVVVG